MEWGRLFLDRLGVFFAAEDEDELLADFLREGHL